ncbi:RING/U-box superfamily protein [Melia azedarach]|uniref:RING/U-box superfamily protein n=2 Tax=Melia azedarach TaxID=155640 RepID=A0ACC1XFZ3_MELAZ|nr:RING/U-box superfamily protein [Melia azedarach]KAJ4709707.1 RING/U-box superfamily protein [Melia azedarach]
MDGYSGKRAVDGLVVSRKNSGLVLRDTVNNRDRNAQICSRTGCSGRLNSVKGTQIGCTEKAKSSRPSFRPSSSGKELIGSSSRTCSAVSNARKSSTNPRKKLPSQLETDSSETSSVHDEPDVPELIAPPGKIQRGLQPETEDSDSREVIVMEEGSSSVASNTRSRRNFHQRSGVGSQDVLVGSSVPLVPRNPSQATSANTNRHGLRNLRCNSISDVIPSSSGSLADLSFSRKKDIVKKRNSEGGSSSSSRGKKTSETSSELRNHNSTDGISIYDSRRSRNWTPNRDNGVTSVRTRRSTNSTYRMRLSNQGNGNSVAPNESPVVIPRLPESDISVNQNVPTSSPQFSAEIPSGLPSSYSPPGSSNGGLRGLLPGNPSEVGIPRSVVNRDNFGRYNIDGIAEVLLALERIEQDEELSYEQLLVLETNLLLNGLNFYDQHRDMRLDIDNMSYEELLALEERMGSVSTALTEVAISKCLETSIYQSTPLKEGNFSCSRSNDDVKCSICQEEYAAGDEIGRLHCLHRYHVACIEQWLRLKNWCPICKASAEPLTT